MTDNVISPNPSSWATGLAEIGGAVRNYSEASYFGGYHFQHIADWLENERLRRIERNFWSGR